MVHRRNKHPASAVPIPGFISNHRLTRRLKGLRDYGHRVFGPDPAWAATASRRNRIAHAMGYWGPVALAASMYGSQGQAPPMPTPQNYLPQGPTPAY